ncbi:hypothetical protein Val02_61660 [Virgisporangium aliadipatigenens]|uniref:N-acetyltransferase domain-containing protein n=1 Tax=Virgisporangium aliadipatigenens TaxID=741659 RepID=A0A8J3YSW4_9ACTN|nr:GNAT family N-acetyltransferase [Virgisporangium aliadipatigenens]GIJ49280.1 hypothetical protein Val02_61660 [Virgisporangium aliadipatigenens]
MFSIDAFDPNDAPREDLADYHRAYVSAARIDHPHDPEVTLDEAVGRLRTPLPYFGPCRYWAARADGRLVGMIIVGFPADNETRHLVVVDGTVDPAHRRRGIGTALLREVLPAVREAGRGTVFVALTEGSTGDHFLRATGFTRVYREHLQRLDLTTADPSVWDVAAPEGYRIVEFDGPAPEELVASYARANGSIGDMPQQDRAHERPLWTVERVRATEADLARQGIERHAVVAVHEATGEVAGLTGILIYPHRPSRGIQDATTVVPAHRGHGLGFCVKSAMLRWIRAERPRVEWAMCSNADDNAHMLDINRRLGYTVMRVIISVEQDLADLEKRLRPS